jgi:hypothetical protein
LDERNVIQEVRGSTPLGSTNFRRMNGRVQLMPSHVMRAVAFGLFAFALASCTAGGTIADLVPHSMGGLPKNAPPRPGTPEYEDYRKKIEGQAEAKPEAERPNTPAAGRN